MSPCKKVYVSYSQDVEKKTRVIDDLERNCTDRNIRLVYDRKVLGHGDSIKAFMKQLSHGEHIITIFSDSYFKSPACMYELLSIWRQEEFSKRTLAILIPGCRLFEPLYSPEIVNYWNNEHQKLEAEANKHNSTDMIKTLELVKKYQEIKQNVDELIVFAADRYTTPIDELKAKSYEQIFDKINPISSSFIDIIAKKIRDSLDKPEFRATFTKFLCEELNQVLTKLNMEVIDCEPNMIAQNLIHALQVGGKECPVINQVLTNTSFDCFDGGVNLQRYESARQYHKEIAVCIEELLGYLVLSLVNERDAQVVGGILGQNWEGSYFELHVQTLGGVEMFIARESKRKASFVVNGNKLSGQHAIPVSSSSFSWNANARLNDFQLMIWNTVFDENRMTPLTQIDIDELKAELSTLRTVGRDSKPYYVAIRLENDCDAVYQNNVDQFLASLEIPTLCFGLKGGSPALNGIECYVMSAVRIFLQKFIKLIGKK